MEYEAELKKRGAPFKHCLVNTYLRKFPFEDEEDVPNLEYYLSDDDECVMRPNAHEIVKRFLKQVRESNVTSILTFFLLNFLFWLLEIEGVNNFINFFCLIIKGVCKSFIN